MTYQIGTVLMTTRVSKQDCRGKEQMELRRVRRQGISVLVMLVMLGSLGGLLLSPRYWRSPSAMYLKTIGPM